ncbi:unnamed protein product [Penicillium salamii]|uniref:Uncharacterized protein n=1 Tax=Penicillium salamii TaxID=1612424 RepID=A0A9W4JWF2_9EURO|nr:unnamed protein product [Penicillium salamii]CAG8027916.1 unnamed protein product [Penicillium salamii]CAG8062909.1 unnamed protein product [Penicillium salamii]CAG8080157.1 unnamed protein product [Penicillium salamii]CAG8187334.1 unnamed protein product [Penicillium salamii]
MWKGVDYAIIKSKAWTLGCIYDVSKEHYVYGRQSFKVVLSNTGHALGSDYLPKEDCILKGFTHSIQDGDLIWILQGASNPTVLRLCGDHFTVILPAIPRKDAQAKPFEKTVEHNCQYPPDDVVFTWGLPHIQEKTSTRPAKLAEKVSSSNYHESRIETQSRWRHIELAILDIYSNARRDRAFATDAFKNIMTLGCPECVPLGKIAIATAANTGHYGLEIMMLLFQEYGEKLPITDETVQTAAANTGPYSRDIMNLLFENRGERLPVSDKTVQAAAANIGHNGPDIMKLLFWNRGEKLLVSDKAVHAAAANCHYGHEIMRVFFEKRGEKLNVSDEVVQAAAANTGYHGWVIMNLLFENRGERLPVSDKTVQAAAANPVYGPERIQVLLQNCRKRLAVSDQVVQAAAANPKHGHKIMQILSGELWGEPATL